MTMMSDLSIDLLEEILCRVPATSLKRLRSTCKLWNILFNDKRFTRKHFDKAKKQFKILVLNEDRLVSISVKLYENPYIEPMGEFSLIDPLSHQFQISNVYSHCDGLLLCATDEYEARVVVWNPCNNHIRWIQKRNKYDDYALGSYYDIKKKEKSYKILSDYYKEFSIYEFNSNSWRILDVMCDYNLLDFSMSLKGKTYWFGLEDNRLDIFLVSFDYTTERFESINFPRKCSSYEPISLSLVREEKLAVLLRRGYTSKKEIWVTNKIGDDTTKVVSWSMVLLVDFDHEYYFTWHDGLSFFVYEEKKIIMCMISTLELENTKTTKTSSTFLHTTIK